MRTGIGYDIHRLVEGRRLVLGGVELPGPVGLAGHSDGDAVLHAIADAILGAAALGDLGEHFPDTADEWRDADSADILSAVVKMAAERSLAVHNVDVNVVAERPKLGAAKAQMRRKIAAILGVPPGRVSVKARTAEGLGPVGRGEAIEAQAVVLLDEIGSQQDAAYV
jgi:2-C-methyl-D-erythritol 2,4-cyclodiphosphate synthase